MSMYYLPTKDCSLAVYERGVSNASIGILFLHGGPGSGAKAIMDLPAFQALEEAYPCTYFDQRGCGKSTYDLFLHRYKGLPMEDITYDVYLVALDMKKRRNLSKIILWGGSFGGCLAALCLERFPELFAGCVLSSPAITFHREQSLAFFQRMQEPYKARFTTSSILPFPKEAMMTPEAFFMNPEVRSFIFSSANPSNSLRHICAMGEWFFQHHFHGLLASLKIPCLLLQGKEDPICIYQNIDHELKTCKNPLLSYHLYENCGHAVFEDQPQEFVREIVTFIKEISLC